MHRGQPIAMEGTTLKSRAVSFALATGAIAFVLALAATYPGEVTRAEVARALILAIVLAAMCWAWAERSISTVAAAIDAAIARMASAAQGNLTEKIPDEIQEYVPQLAESMAGLFRQIDANMANAHRLAMFDPVTGLPNRTNFRRTCERTLLAMKRTDHGVLLFIDLDRFKSVNDTLGHAMGDMLLGMVGNRLRAVADRFGSAEASEPPLIGRLAGDEFTMFFSGIGERAEAMRIARGVLYALGEPFDLAGNDVEIGASIGIALRPEHGTALTDLMRAADTAMYHAKSNGRGRAEFFSETLAAELADRAQLDLDLRVAVDRGEFKLVYQPQVACDDGRLVAAEALLRWVHPRLGVTLPGAFLRRAEESGLIVEIGDWVVEAVAETIARWGRMGVAQRLAINISPRQLDHAQFSRRLRAAMHAAQAPAHLLELEITETMAMHCSDDVLDAVAALRADGARVVIDDFGTGYSNLARLRALPVDRIKLDRSLIAPVADSAEARAVVQAVVALVHSMGCEAVAEGVETAAQASVLRVIGCDVIQGFAIAEPMEEAAFLAWVASDRPQAQAG